VHLQSLELVNWRNYEHAAVGFPPGPQLLTGGNGDGKTNLLEAVHYLATGRSHRTSDEAALVHRGAHEGVLRAALATGTRARRAELALRPGGRNRARLDGTQQPRFGDVIGHLRAVLFAPEDLALVRGDPADRRRFLDDLLAQRRPAYRGVRHDYDRALRQRNALLKQLGDRSADDGSLRSWTESLVRLGARIVAARLMACAALEPPTAARYAELAGQASDPPAVRLWLERSTHDADATAGVDPNPDVAALAEELRETASARAQEERERGMSLVGPHRDDLHLELDGLPARTHASQGEAWSMALALRLGSQELLREVGDDPIVLLDDVFAELDADRRRRLAGWCETCEQVLVTAAVPEDVPLQARRFDILGGRIADAHMESDR
jgi:DNA replication and repair protein RecF